MQFDTKIAAVIRTDLETWQKLNVAAFLAGGIAAAFSGCVGEPYEDGSGTQYLPLIGRRDDVERSHCRVSTPMRP